MTQIELRTMEAVQSINRKLRDQHSCNWEERRYEIAKFIYPYFIQKGTELLQAHGDQIRCGGMTITEAYAKSAVEWADALINELDKTKSET